MRKLRSKEYGGKGKLNSCEVNYKRKDGAIFMIRLSAAIVYSGDQEVASVGFFYDLRDRMEMERKLEKTRIQLLQAEKMSSLGKLAAGVAHQLNNPLGGITLYAQLMMEEYPLEDAAREDLKRIIDDAERCRNTVRELLEFARQTRQEIRLNDLNHAISRTLFLLENQSLFHNIEIIKSLEKNLGIKMGGTTPDRFYTLSSARCFGACGLAPVITVAMMTSSSRIFHITMPKITPTAAENRNASITMPGLNTKGICIRSASTSEAVSAWNLSTASSRPGAGCARRWMARPPSVSRNSPVASAGAAGRSTTVSLASPFTT